MKKILFILTISGLLNCTKKDTTPDPTPTTQITLTGNILFQRLNYAITNSPGELFILNPSTTLETQLTNFTVNGTQNIRTENGSWNGTKTKIVFTSYKDNLLKGAIYSANSDGTSVTRLTYNSFYDSSPKYSPDGNKIAFSRSVQPIAGAVDPAELVIMNADGTNQVVLTNVSLGGTLSKRIEGVYWNGNSEIFFSSNKDYSRNDIYKINTSTSVITRITTNIGNQGDFEISPDGTYIVYSKATVPAIFELEEIYKIKTDGTGEIRLTGTSVNGTQNIYSMNPSWTSDGKILFTSNRDEQTYGEIYVMNGDGTTVTRITTNTKSEDQPRLR